MPVQVSSTLSPVSLSNTATPTDVAAAAGTPAAARPPASSPHEDAFAKHIRSTVGFATGATVGATAGALMAPVGGAALFTAGQAVAMFFPPVAFASTMANARQVGLPWVAALPAAAFHAAFTVPMGILLAAGGAAWMASTPFVSPVAALASAGFWGAWGAKQANLPREEKVAA